MTKDQQAALEQVARDIITYWVAAQNIRRPDPFAKWSQDCLAEQIVKALAARRAVVLEEAAILAREFSTPFDIDVWRDSTKKEMTARVMLAFADKLQTLAQERTP